MLYARKLNVQVTIKEEEKDSYIASGYTIYQDQDGKGKGFKKIASPESNLKEENAKLKKEINELKVKNENLTKELLALKEKK